MSDSVRVKEINTLIRSNQWRMLSTMDTTLLGIFKSNESLQGLIPTFIFLKRPPGCNTDNWRLCSIHLNVISRQTLQGHVWSACFVFSYLVPFGLSSVSIHSRLSFVWKEAKGIHLQCAVEIWQRWEKVEKILLLKRSLWMHYMSNWIS